MVFVSIKKLVVADAAKLVKRDRNKTYASYIFLRQQASDFYIPISLHK